ncbi:hypothetical protein ACS15_3836 [Ralstonia insidiosa]|uniref:Uncharacterized protein n=1 Tax=Ralstonia insidiosa TaxID=190721 RepID=A0AAC9FPH4_9RALS|nr:hypothetical protein ACS15_3836 [Ralstonia insidiosa]
MNPVFESWAAQQQNLGQWLHRYADVAWLPYGPILLLRSRECRGLRGGRRWGAVALAILPRVSRPEGAAPRNL